MCRVWTMSSPSTTLFLCTFLLTVLPPHTHTPSHHDSVSNSFPHIYILSPESSVSNWFFGNFTLKFTFHEWLYIVISLVQTWLRMPHDVVSTTCCITSDNQLIPNVILFILILSYQQPQNILRLPYECDSNCYLLPMIL